MGTDLSSTNTLLSVLGISFHTHVVTLPDQSIRLLESKEKPETGADERSDGADP